VDTYNLLAESLRQALYILAKLEEKDLEFFAAPHDFGRSPEPSFKGRVSMWDSEEDHQVALNSLVADCDRVLGLGGEKLSAYSSESDEAKDLPSKILLQDITRSNEGKSGDNRGSRQGQDSICT